MLYKFTNEELAYLETQAKERGQAKRSSQVRTNKYDQKRSDYDVDILGTLSEFAVAKLVNGHYNSEIYKKHGDDGINDIKIDNLDKTFQIKSTSYTIAKNPLCFYNHLDIDENGFCTCHKKKIKKGEVFLADYTIMCLGTDDKNIIDVHGYISREDFLKKHIAKDLGYGTRYGIRAEQLNPLEELIAEIESQKAALCQSLKI